MSSNDKIIKKIINSAFIILASMIIGFVLLILVFLIPVDRIVSNVTTSLHSLNQETDYFSVTRGINGSTFDNYTEANYLNESMVPAGENIIKTVLSGYIYAENGTPVEELSKIIRNNKICDTYLKNRYIRFWNGYEIFVKPAIFLMKYSDIRNINMFIHFIITFVFFVLLIKNKFFVESVAFLIGYIFLNPITMICQMTFTLYYYNILISSILILLFNDILNRKGLYEYLFLISGISVIYFCMNYIQLLTFGIPYIVYFLMNIEKSKKEIIYNFVYYFSFWFLGYAGMMVGKWIVYAIFVNPDIFGKMFASILVRTSSIVSETETGLNIRILAIVKNTRAALINNKFVILEFLFLITLIGYYFKNEYKFKFNDKYFLFSILMLVIVIARFIIFANHVYIHFWVTYRLLLLPILTFNLFIIKSFGDKNI